MARARSLRPGFFKNDLLVELPFEARLLFAGLWTLADKKGRLEDRPKKIKMELFPADDVDIDALLTSLADKRFITRYNIDEKSYIEIDKFLEHQNPHPKEPESVIPEPLKIAASNGKPRRSREKVRTPVKEGEESKDVRKPKEEGCGEGEPTKKFPNGNIGAVFLYWQEVHKHPKACLDEHREKIISRALKRYSVEDLKQAIDGCKLSPHHQGKNDKGTVYDDIELICRDSKHVEQFMSYAENGLVGPADPYEAIERLYESYGNKGTEDKPVH